MLAKFRNKYPQGSLVSELLEIDRGFYLVKVSIQVEKIVLATGLAGASTIEAAEDAARERAIAALILDNSQPAVTNNSTENTVTTPIADPSFPEPTTQTASLDTQPSHKIVNFSKPQAEPSAPLEDPVAEEVSASILESIPTSTELEAKIQPEVPQNPEPSLFSGTFDTPEAPSAEEDLSSAATVNSNSSNSAIATANLEDMDFNEIKQKTDIEIKRLGWTKDDGREFLKSRYGKRSRLHLTDEQLLEFLGYLEQQPTPVK